MDASQVMPWNVFESSRHRPKFNRRMRLLSLSEARIDVGATL